MKSLVVAITLVLSTQFVTAAMKAGSAVNVTDQTRVKCSFVIGSNRTINTPPRKLLDDSALLPTLRAKEKSTTLRADEMMQQTGIRFQENRGQIVDTRGKLRPEIAFVANAPGAKLYFRNDGISTVFTKTVHTRIIDLPLEGIGSENVSPWGEIKRGSENVSPCWEIKMGSENVSPWGEIKRGSENVSPWGEIKRGSENVSPWGEIKRGDNQREEIQTYRLDMKLVGCNPFARIRAEGELPGYVSYYLAHCPDGITGVKEYSRIVYESVYDNIDLELFSTNGKMKYNFVVRPGGRVSDIRMKYDGASETALMNDGALSVATPLGRIEEATPYTYSGDESNEVSSRFLRRGNTVSFAVDDYDSSQTLVIDPWATYYGGSGSESAQGISIDANGNVIISGNTMSTNFPVLNGFQSSNSGGNDAFVVKFDANGTRLWATYYGGSGDDRYVEVATDPSNNIVIAGINYGGGFPVTQGAFQTNSGGGRDLFIVKFTSGGSRLWATYYGGHKDEGGIGRIGLSTDMNGNILVASETGSNNFPVSQGAFQTSKNGKNSDACVVKLNGNGNRLWATYYGGSGGDHSNAIATDVAGNVFFTGGTTSTNFPITAGVFQSVNAGSFDGYIVKFNSAGGRVWATYYGGTGSDQFQGITIDGNSDVIITGWTNSTNFPVSLNAFQTSYGGGNDAFVIKFTNGGTRQWATYYGGSSSDEGDDITTDSENNIVFTGATSSSNFPISVGALQTSLNGGADVCIVKLSSSGSRFWATYYGGSATGVMDVGYGISTDAADNIFFAGVTTSTDFPLYGTPFQNSYAGSWDAFIVSLNSNGLFSKRTHQREQLPTSISLQQNYPNPFNPTTMIKYSIPEDMHVRLYVLDVHGRRVSELVNERYEAGEYSVTFDASNIPSGAYLYRLETDNSSESRIMIIAK